MEYVDKAKLIALIKKSDLNGVYSIANAFSIIYYMGNVKDFYLADVKELQELSEVLENYINKGISGITRRIAYNNLLNTITNILARLG